MPVIAIAPPTMECKAMARRSPTLEARACRGRGRAVGSTGPARADESALALHDLRKLQPPRGHNAQEIERMHAAWTKSVLLEIALWSRPYVNDGLW